MEGVLELHWEREPYGALRIQIYDRHSNGQLSLVAAEDFGPFDGPSDVARWLTRALASHQVAPAR